MERPSFWNVPKEFRTKTNSPIKSVSFNPNPIYNQDNVQPGSPAHNSGLRNGDIINQINNQPAGHMSHQRATDLIKNCGYSINLNIDRNSNLPITPPISPQSVYTPQSMYSTQNSLLSPTGSSLSSGGSLYRPQHMCSTNSAGIIPSFENVTRDYQCPLAQEKRQFYEERARERASVITQPHRTLPVVTPKPKSVHDYPVGSYLKYMKDPNWHSTPARSPIPQSEKLRNVASQYGASPNEKLVNLQYNSPINIYSTENVAKAFLPNAKNNDGTELNITHSPTYQLLREEDELRRQNRVSPAFNRNEYPVQSHSFNTLRTSLLNAPGC